ncbi:transferase, Chloramphenicol acetyltransferase-like domain protein [Artemisia annua]|uniref:Transferase, Chloramphenicol acetyltransferase-like domain protein n=1 Tax=Artemisia annua TaxID=35608 RepID=A0A2U1KT01_ARTAN|nr:transferase, Chloramphenicol acetyltransferase-like domain protein [Artemisia annua]
MQKMASLPVSILNVLEQSKVSPPPATVSDTSYPLTFFDILYLLRPPIHFLFFYELPLTNTQFLETIVPKLKHSLSITLKHFFPFAGNLIVFPTSSKIPEMRYAENDSVNVTFAECDLDFNDLTGYHPRNCDKFHHLIPQLGEHHEFSDYLKIPVFSLQVTNFPNFGISIGMTIHHSLVDASTQFSFLKAWTAITKFGNDESFLASGTLPIYERIVKYPNLDEALLKRANVETLFNGKYQPPKLPDSANRVRATFVMSGTLIDSLKKLVLTKLPTLPYVSSFTVACAYIWCCIAKARTEELHLFLIPLDCRSRMDPPIPTAYFGNCIWGSITVAETALLRGKEGFITAAKLMGENLHKTLNDKDGVVNEKLFSDESFSGKKPLTMISIAGTPKLKLYDIDFGWGKPKKLERVSLDYGASISIDAGKECDKDIEIGVCLTNAQMEVFARNFNLGLEQYI